MVQLWSFFYLSLFFLSLSSRWSSLFLTLLSQSRKIYKFRENMLFKGPYFSQEFCVIFLFVGAHNSKENIVNLLTKKVIWYPNFFFINVVPKRPWWPSGLSHCSNSSRVAAEDPGLNPCSGLGYCSELPAIVRADSSEIFR